MAEASAVVAPAQGVPGLCNVFLPDGRSFYELTMGQVRDLARREPSLASWLDAKEKT